jgi:hypothetical protein
MTEYEDCESVFHTEIDEKTWKWVGKKIAAIRTELNKRSYHFSRK